MFKILANKQSVENIANLIKLSKGKLDITTSSLRGFAEYYRHIDLVYNNKNDFILTLGNPPDKHSHQIHAHRNSDEDFWDFEYINHKF